METAAKTLPFAYNRHEPEKTLVYKTLAREWDIWLAERNAETEKSPLPAYVTREIEAFFRCGILGHGFVLNSCEGCGAKLPTAFSCKKRGFCPSCCAKRMSETTVHLIDNVLPVAPCRQWVTTFPYALRFWMATNRDLTNDVHKIVSKMIMAYYEAKAEERGIADPIAGGVTFIQRFGSALQLAPHMHSVAIEGVFSVTSGDPVFYPLPGPSDEEVSQVVEAIADATITLLREQGRLSEDGKWVERPDAVDKEFADSEQLTLTMAASTKMRIAFGPRAGQMVRRIGRGFGYEEEIPIAKGRRCFSIHGFTLHANRFIGQQEREKLEDLLAYGSRGSFSNLRLSLKDPDDPTGDLVYSLKRAWSDGTQAIVLSPSELIEKIVALIPPPYCHLSRYFGILSSHSKWRRLIVLKPHVKKGFVATTDGGVERMTWSKLLKRVFKADITRCSICGGRIYPDNCEIVTEPAIVIAMLRALGLDHHPPPRTPARRRDENLDIDQTPHYDETQAQ